MNEITGEKEIVKSSGTSVKPVKVIFQSKLNRPTQAQINGQWQQKDKLAPTEKKWIQTSSSVTSTPLPVPPGQKISKKYQDISSKLHSPTSASLRGRIDKSKRNDATGNELNVANNKTPSPLSSSIITTATLGPNDRAIPATNKISPSVLSRPPIASNKKYSEVQSRLHVPTATCLRGKVTKHIPKAESPASIKPIRPVVVLTSTTRTPSTTKPSESSLKTITPNLPKNNSVVINTGSSRQPLSVVQSIKSTGRNNAKIATTSDVPAAPGGPAFAKVTDAPASFDFFDPAIADATDALFGLENSDPVTSDLTAAGFHSADSATVNIAGAPVGFENSDFATANATDASVGVDSTYSSASDVIDTPVGLVDSSDTATEYVTDATGGVDSANFATSNVTDGPVCLLGSTDTTAELVADVPVDIGSSDTATEYAIDVTGDVDSSNFATADITDGPVCLMGNSDIATVFVADIPVDIGSSNSANAYVTEAPVGVHSSNSVTSDVTDALEDLDSSVNDCVVVSPQQPAERVKRASTGGVGTIGVVEKEGAIIEESEEATF